jgi:hypothetical protein
MARVEEGYDLVVIIVNWNGLQKTTDCVDSLQKTDNRVKARVVVYDNGSTDGSVTHLRQKFPGVEIIAGPANLGFARANNQVLQQFQGQARYYLLLNNDTVVEPHTLSRMVEFMDAHPQAGIAGCKIRKTDGSLDWPCKRSYITPSVLFYKALGLDRLFPKSRRFGRYQLTFLHEDQIHEVDSVVGAFLMIREECLQQIGLLDDSFFMYGEDLDWCYRSKAGGWKVYYAPMTTVIHYKGQSSGNRSFRMIYHWYHSTWQVYQKHMASRYPVLVNALIWAGFHVMCVASLAANSLRSEKRVPGRR